MSQLFLSTSAAARALLAAAWSGDATISAKAAQFAGQISVGDEPLSEKQRAWLETLLRRAGLPSLTEVA